MGCPRYKTPCKDGRSIAMSSTLSATEATAQTHDPDERELRQQLAAAYRTFDHLG